MNQLRVYDSRAQFIDGVKSGMASSRAYLDFILEQLSGVDGITWKPMMGEYILYMNGRIIGGIYDDRFLVKPTP